MRKDRKIAYLFAYIQGPFCFGLTHILDFDPPYKSAIWPFWSILSCISVGSMISIDFPFVRQTLICRSFLILFRFVPSEEPAMVSFDKDGIFVDVSVPLIEFPIFFQKRCF